MLGLQSGHVIYEGGDLHWLSWLLTLGDSTIVVGYYYDPETGVGRSGLGTMSEGGFFRVPPEFSGTRANNFVTRALIGNKQQEQILNILKSTMTKHYGLSELKGFDSIHNINPIMKFKII